VNTTGFRNGLHSTQIVSSALSAAAPAPILSTCQSAQVAAWTPNRPMTIDRYSHTATLLPNGKVLVAGGFSPPRSSAELPIQLHQQRQVFLFRLRAVSVTGS